MTCIVGWIEQGICFIAGDSAAVDTTTYGLAVQHQSKVFRNGPMVFGYTTSFRMGQLLEHALVVPPQGADETVERYMVTTFINAVRECLKSHGWAGITNNNETGGDFLVGYRGRLFMVGSQFNVNESIQPYASVGAAHAVAQGALYASLRAPAIAPDLRLFLALEAAEVFNVAVRQPFHIVETERWP